ncbi:sushi, von Willebrand factor type A, EGF and pentraxin domain-containing protein 1-like isoform X1 [Sycon ciliatum]|uniref:sushi, von Willebrand factor type A, EGF and pentraxin domain-containing protein 1-like isoform X1 n=1 Tax=Sycon ciliatum TaxID=27933 RepID=UPI0031F5F5A4
MSIKELQAIVNSASYLLGMAYECSQGYVLNGTALQLCIANETLRPPSPPSCAVVQCNVSLVTECRGSTRPDPAVSFDYGTNVSLSCQPEFYLLKPGYLTCNANATSSTHCPVCQPIPCNTSSFPTPVNGQIVRGHHTVQVNKSLPITCRYGYTPSTTNASVQCLLGEIWETTNITCEIISCGQPSNISNGSYNGTNYTYNSTVTYSCDDAYEIAGGQTTRTCGVNGNEGKWEGEPLICKAIPCNTSSFPTPVNGQIVRAHHTVQVNKSLPITCRYGYTPSTANASVQCLLGEIWQTTNITCDIISCGQPSNISNGSYNGTNFTYNSTVTYSCDDAYEIAGGQTTRTCGVNGNEGKWDGELLICKAIPCKLDELKTKISPDKFEIQQQTDTVAVGDNVPISCQRGYKLSSRTNVTCEIGSVWKSISASSRCDAITCNSGKIEIENGEVGIAHNTSFGSIRSLTCDSGFGKSPCAYQITCTETGHWSTAVECRADSLYTLGTVIGAGIGGMMFGILALTLVAVIVYRKMQSIPVKTEVPSHTQNAAYEDADIAESSLTKSDAYGVVESSPQPQYELVCPQ